MDKLTYDPIVEIFPFAYTVEDLRTIYLRLRPLFAEEERQEKVIQIKDE